MAHSAASPGAVPATAGTGPRCCGALGFGAQAAFPDHITLEFPHARHYIQEDAPGEIAQAITSRFG